MKQFTIKKHLSWILIGILILQMMVMGIPISAVENEHEENLLENPGFEELNDDGHAASWAAKDDWETGAVTTTPEAARSGSEGVKMEINNSDNYFIVQTVEIEGDKAYELSSWIKSNIPSSGYVQMKVEFYRDTANLEGSRGDVRSDKFGTYDDWENISMQVESPSDANIAQVYLRLYGPGMVQFDDASFHMTAHIPGVNILADRIFYYEDKQEGKITGATRSADGMYDDKSVDIQVYSEDDGTVVLQENGLPASEDFHFNFDPSIMNLQEPYTVEVALQTDEGETLFSDTETIYRWERPTTLREDGTIMVDGEPFYPVKGYKPHVEDFSKVDEAVNVVSGNKDRTDDFDAIQYYLDEAHKQGLKVIQSLKASIGDLDGRYGYEYAKEKVERFKDHPALLAWNIADEPEIHGIPMEDLAEIYKIVRTIDPVHPTYMVVAGMSHYETYGRITDVLAPDIYPLPNGPITTVGDGIEKATNLFPERPTWSILQAFKLPPNYPYAPNVTELRHMAYQSMLEGAQGLAYYSFTGSTWDLMDSELYPGIVSLYQKEMPYFSKFLLEGQQVDAHKDEGVQWKLWEHNNKLYAVAINLTEEAQTTVISLPEQGYHVKTIGPEFSQNSTFDNTLPLELAGLESTLIELTPFSSSAEIKALATDLESEGEFSSDRVAHALTLHLSAIDQFEQQEATEKVVKHMTSFIQLLNHQKENALISEDAYNTLKINGESVIQKSVETLLQMKVDIPYLDMVGGDMLQGQVTLKNISDEPITDLTLTIPWPEAFHLAPEEQTIQSLQPGETIEVEFEVEIPVATPVGNYQLMTEVHFSQNGVDMGYMRQKQIDILPLIKGNLVTKEINAMKPGEYPITFTIKNNANRMVDIAFEGKTSEDISLQLDSPIQIDANETAEVEGLVHLSSDVTEEEHTLTIHSLVDGERMDQQSLAVNFTKNLLENPSFEHGGSTPDGWQLRDASWVTDDVHSGEYAVALIPDSENDWNVFNSRERLPVEEGETYRFSWWAKFASEEDRASIGLREADGTNAVIDYNWESIGGESNSEWLYYEVEFTPTDSATEQIQVFGYIGRQNTERVLFDDFRLEEITKE